MNRSKILPAIIRVGVCLIACAVLLAVFRETVGIQPLPQLELSSARAEPAEFVVSSQGRAENSASQRRGLVTEEEPVSANDPPPQQPTPLETAQGKLAYHATAALDGVLFVNEVLDQMLEFASLPVDEHPDLAFEDDDAVAYKLKGTPVGTEARILVGMMPYDADGKSYRYLQMGVDINVGKSEFLLDSVREGPHIEFSISYDVADEMAPSRFGLLLTRPVDITASRDAGINAYYGRYTSGALFGVDLLKNPHRPTTATIGIVDANPVNEKSFGGVSPLAGDIQLDITRVTALLKQLQAHLSTIKGKKP